MYTVQMDIKTSMNIKKLLEKEIFLLKSVKNLKKTI